MQGFAYYTILIFLTGMLGIWKAVPLGFALGVNAFFVWLMTSLGAATAAVILYFFGNQIRKFLQDRKKKQGKTKSDARAHRLFEKYGTAGLGFFGCLLIGPNMTMLIGLVLVNSTRKLLYWTIAGIITWTFVLTVVAVLSIDLFQDFVAFFSG